MKREYMQIDTKRKENMQMDSKRKENMQMDTKQKENMQMDTKRKETMQMEDTGTEDYTNSGKPFFYCDMVTRYPKTAFAVTLGCHLTMLVVVITLVKIGYDVFPVNFKTFPLDIRGNKYYLRGLSWQFRNQDEKIIKRGTLDMNQQPERTHSHEIITWMFQEENSNILNKANLLQMKEVEDNLFDILSYQNEFCLLAKLQSNMTCQNPVSILRFFDGTFENIDPDFYDPGFDNIPNVLYKASYYNETKEKLEYHVNVNAKITKYNISVNAVRSYMSIGSPLRGYNNVSDRKAEQQEKIETFLSNDFVPVIDEYYQKGVESMQFFYESRTILQIYVNKNVRTDMLLANGSFCFIFLFMWFQTGSLWVTGWGVLSILTGFCATNLVYRIPLDFRYFGVFHVLALFLILGIGADDIFVFFDTWKQSGHNKYKSLAHRLTDCYRKAALAMLYTSVTTAVAFIVSATSPFLAVYTFGIFSGILVCVNYLSVIIYFPCVVIMYHIYFEKYKCCCCCVKHEYQEVPNDPSKIVGDKEKIKRKNVIIRFFAGPYFKIVTNKVLRWIILIVYTASLGVLLYFATQMKVNEDQIKFLPENTNIARYLALRANSFSTVDSPIQVFVVFGLKEQDLSPCHRTDSLCFGSTVWDDSFDLNDPESQQALMNLCHKLQNLPDDQVSKLHIKRNLVSRKLEVQCFLEDLQEYLETKTNLPTPVFPVNKSKAMSLMSSTPEVYNTSLLSDQYSRWFETVSSYWLYNGFRPPMGLAYPDFKTYNLILGEGKQPGTISKVIDDSFTYKYNTKLKYAALVVTTTINPRTIGYVKGQVVREDWETFINQQISEMPTTLQGGYQTTTKDSWAFNLWHWLEIQQTLATTAIRGLIIGLSLSLPILILATMNVFVGLLATLTLSCITVSVVGIIPLAGWKLGILESLNLVLVVGLSVDYCVHLAVAYSRAPYPDRKSRVRYALEELGISVLSGCCSTLGASMFLMFSHIQFFTQFGSFMFCTIGFSFLYALGFFVTLLGIIGPEKDSGSLMKIFQKCCSCCKRPKGDEVKLDSIDTKDHLKDSIDKKDTNPHA